MKISCKKTTSPVETSSKILFGITLIILLVFLFTLFVPFNQSFAQQIKKDKTFIITAGSSTIKIDTNTKITGDLTQYSNITSSTKIYFYSNPKVEGFNGIAFCNLVYTETTNTYSCFVNFRSSAEGIYKISAYNNDKTYNAKEISVEVKKEIIPPTPPVVPTNTTYTPLAPLPGLGDNGTSFETDKSKNACPFGNYLNIMIKLILGMAAVLAMVMITMGGIQYMTSDLVSSKEAGKETVTNAILGLLIGLGAWLILNTINPKLLVACLDKLPQAEIAIEEAPPTAADFPSEKNIPNGSLGSCSEGIKKINTNNGTFTLCGKISNNIQSLVNKANSENYKISGWGWRSNQTQKDLRIKNGCPDVNKSPPSKCRVPTAIPGTSMHESGLALDFTCDGVGIQTHDNKCFIWLKNNINSYGLKNLASEPWHWSTNGH